MEIRLITNLATDIITYTGCPDEDALAMARQFYEQLWQEYMHGGLIYGSSESGLMRWMVARLSASGLGAVGALNENLQRLTLPLLNTGEMFGRRGPNTPS